MAAASRKGNESRVVMPEAASNSSSDNSFAPIIVTPSMPKPIDLAARSCTVPNSATKRSYCPPRTAPAPAAAMIKLSASKVPMPRLRARTLNTCSVAAPLLRRRRRTGSGARGACGRMDCSRRGCEKCKTAPSWMGAANAGCAAPGAHCPPSDRRTPLPPSI